MVRTGVIASTWVLVLSLVAVMAHDGITDNIIGGMAVTMAGIGMNDAGNTLARREIVIRDTHTAMLGVTLMLTC